MITGLHPATEERAPDDSSDEVLTRRSSKRFKVTIGVLVGLFVLVYFWRAMFITIDPGHSGVLWKRFRGGIVRNIIFGEGLHVIYPWDSIDIFDTRVQEMHEEVNLLTKRGLAVSMTMSARFHPEFQYLADLDQRLGPKYRENAVWPEVVSALRRVVGKYTPEEIYALGEDGLLAEVYEAATTPVSNCFVRLDRVLLTKVVLPQRVQDAIQEKTTQEQKVATYSYLLEQAELEKKRSATEAVGIRQFENLSGISMLKWRSIEAAEKLAASPNAKIIVMGNGSSMPFVLSPDK